MSDRENQCVITIKDLDPRKIHSFNYTIDSSDEFFSVGTDNAEIPPLPSEIPQAIIDSFDDAINKDSIDELNSRRSNSVSSCDIADLGSKRGISYKNVRRMSTNVKWLVWSKRVRGF